MAGASDFKIRGEIEIVSGNVNTAVQQIIDKVNKSAVGTKSKVNLSLNLKDSDIQKADKYSDSLTAIALSMRMIADNAPAASQGVRTLSGSMAGMRSFSGAIGDPLKKAGTNIVEFKNEYAKQTKALTSITNSFVDGVQIRMGQFLKFAVASEIVRFLHQTGTAGLSAIVSLDEVQNKLRQITQESTAAVQGLTSQVFTTGRTLGIKSGELLESAEVLAQAGYKMNQIKTLVTLLGETSLGPTFDNMQKTSEGIIAVQNQFKLSTDQLRTYLDTVNTLSKKFAVESADILQAVQSSGSIFAAAGGATSTLNMDAKNAEAQLKVNLNLAKEHAAVITVLRSNTRQSAAVLSTGLRSVSSYLQRPEREDKLRDLFGSDFSLRDVKGEFIGVLEAVEKIKAAMGEATTQSEAYAKVVQIIGGARENRVTTPLLTNIEEVRLALTAAQGNFNSVAKDAETAQDRLTTRLQKIKQEFIGFAATIASSEDFKVFVTMVNSLTSGFISMAASLKPVLPLIYAFTTLTVGKNLLGKLAPGALDLFGPRRTAKAEGGVANIMAMPGEKIILPETAKSIGYPTLEVFNKTGTFTVPGIGNKDNVPIDLPSGSFVIKKSFAARMPFNTGGRTSGFESKPGSRAYKIELQKKRVDDSINSLLEIYNTEESRKDPRFVESISRLVDRSNYLDDKLSTPYGGYSQSELPPKRRPFVPLADRQEILSRNPAWLRVAKAFENPIGDIVDAKGNTKRENRDPIKDAISEEIYRSDQGRFEDYGFTSSKGLFASLINKREGATKGQNAGTKTPEAIGGMGLKDLDRTLNAGIAGERNVIDKTVERIGEAVKRESQKPGPRQKIKQVLLPDEKDVVVIKQAVVEKASVAAAAQAAKDVKRKNRHQNPLLRSIPILPPPANPQDAVPFSRTPLDENSSDEARQLYYQMSHEQRKSQFLLSGGGMQGPPKPPGFAPPGSPDPNDPKNNRLRGSRTYNDARRRYERGRGRLQPNLGMGHPGLRGLGITYFEDPVEYGKFVGRGDNVRANSLIKTLQEQGVQGSSSMRTGGLFVNSGIITDPKRRDEVAVHELTHQLGSGFTTQIDKDPASRAKKAAHLRTLSAYKNMSMDQIEEEINVRDIEAALRKNGLTEQTLNDIIDVGQDKKLSFSDRRKKAAEIISRNALVKPYESPAARHLNDLDDKTDYIATRDVNERFVASRQTSRELKDKKGNFAGIVGMGGEKLDRHTFERDFDPSVQRKIEKRALDRITKTHMNKWAEDKGILKSSDIIKEEKRFQQEYIGAKNLEVIDTQRSQYESTGAATRGRKLLAEGKLTKDVAKELNQELAEAGSNTRFKVDKKGVASEITDRKKGDINKRKEEAGLHVAMEEEKHAEAIKKKTATIKKNMSASEIAARADEEHGLETKKMTKKQIADAHKAKIAKNAHTMGMFNAIGMAGMIGGGILAANSEDPIARTVGKATTNAGMGGIMGSQIADSLKMSPMKGGLIGAGLGAGLSIIDGIMQGQAKQYKDAAQAQSDRIDQAIEGTGMYQGTNKMDRGRLIRNSTGIKAYNDEEGYQWERGLSGMAVDLFSSESYKRGQVNKRRIENSANGYQAGAQLLLEGLGENVYKKALRSGSLQDEIGETTLSKVDTEFINKKNFMNMLDEQEKTAVDFSTINVSALAKNPEGYIAGQKQALSTNKNNLSYKEYLAALQQMRELPKFVGKAKKAVEIQEAEVKFNSERQIREAKNVIALNSQSQISQELDSSMGYLQAVSDRSDRRINTSDNLISLMSGEGAGSIKDSRLDVANNYQAYSIDTLAKTFSGGNDQTKKYAEEFLAVEQARRNFANIYNEHAKRNPDSAELVLGAAFDEIGKSILPSGKEFSESRVFDNIRTAFENKIANTNKDQPAKLSEAIGTGDIDEIFTGVIESQTGIKTLQEQAKMRADILARQTGNTSAIAGERFNLRQKSRSFEMNQSSIDDRLYNIMNGTDNNNAQLLKRRQFIDSAAQKEDATVADIVAQRKRAIDDVTRLDKTIGLNGAATDDQLQQREDLDLEVRSLNDALEMLADNSLALSDAFKELEKADRMNVAKKGLLSAYAFGDEDSREKLQRQFMVGGQFQEAMQGKRNINLSQVLGDGGDKETKEALAGYFQNLNSIDPEEYKRQLDFALKNLEQTGGFNELSQSLHRDQILSTIYETDKQEPADRVAALQGEQVQANNAIKANAIDKIIEQRNQNNILQMDADAVDALHSFGNIDFTLFNEGAKAFAQSTAEMTRAAEMFAQAKVEFKGNLKVELNGGSGFEEQITNAVAKTTTKMINNAFRQFSVDNPGFNYTGTTLDG